GDDVNYDTDFTDDAEFYYLLKFRAGQEGQDGYKELNRRNLPWVFFKFKFDVEDGGIQTDMSSVLNEGETEFQADITGVPSFFLYKRIYNLSTDKFEIQKLSESDMTDRNRIIDWMKTESGTVTGTPNYP